MTELKGLVREVLGENAEILAKIRAGKTGQGFLVVAVFAKMPPEMPKDPIAVLEALEAEVPDLFPRPGV